MHLLTLDMGTSSTRLCLWSNNDIIDEARGGFGAKLGLTDGKNELYKSVGALISALLSKNSVTTDNVEAIVCSGMATSEMGICEIPHLKLPADIYKLAKNLVKKSISEISDIPFLFVPGLKDETDGTLCDIMRGEETESFGILCDDMLVDDVVLMLPGSHNKIIGITKDGQITEFRTTLSGELLDSVVKHTVLYGAITHDFNISKYQVLRGAEHARQNGLTATLFEARVMSKNGLDIDEISSFVYGAVLSEDLPAIKEIAKGKTIYIGGKESFKKVYATLLDGMKVSELSEESSRRATHYGLMRIFKLYNADAERKNVIKAIDSEKLISIVRAPKAKSFEPAVQALYDGGIRLLEVTFDRSGKIPKEETAKMIALIASKYEGKMLVGAGTVTTCEDVMLAYNAGAKFMISPNCDEQIIKLTRKLGLVSIPAALTPTEVVAAISFGADFVKLFPADAFGKGYIKAIKAPISDAKILAVGGVTPENARSYIEAGFSGIGVGSNLYNSKLIAEGRFDEIKETAEKYVNMVK